MIMASAGVHVTLPDYYSPEHLGMIVPKTKDGRVVFMLPWLDATIAGTTGKQPLLSHFQIDTVLSLDLQYIPWQQVELRSLMPAPMHHPCLHQFEPLHAHAFQAHWKPWL